MPYKHIKPVSPDPFIKKGEDMGLVRMGHLNNLIDYVNLNAGDGLSHLALSGGVMTGLITGAHGLLPLAGGTMTGNIVSDLAIGKTGEGYVDFSTANNLILTNDGTTQSDAGVWIYPGAVDLFSGGYTAAFTLKTIASNNHIYGYTTNTVVAFSDDITELAFSKSGLFISGVNGSLWSSPSSDTTAIVASNNSTISASVLNSVIASGNQMTAKTNNTLYANQLSLQASTVTFDALMVPATITADRTYTFPDRDVTVASSTGVQESTTVTTTSGADAVAITGGRHDITTTGTGDALTLANGSTGQELEIVYVAETAGGDTAILTPTTLLGYTTITFNAVGDSVRLSYGTGGWAVITAQGVTLA